MSAIGRVAAVVVASLVVGFAGGYGISQLGGDDSPQGSVAATPPGVSTGTPGTAPAPTTTAAPTPTTATQPPTATTPAQAPTAEVNTLNVSVVSATYVPASTASGRQRKRARLAVKLKVRNRSATPSRLGPASISFGQDSVGSDPAAREAAAGLDKPLAPEQEVTGELRFETADAVTTRLRKQSSVTLNVNGQAVSVPVKK